MLRLLRNKKAQSTMEYALLIAIVIGVFSAMQIYLRRGLQARIRQGSDNIPGLVLQGTTGEAGTSAAGLFNNETQYEPYYIRKGQYGMTTEGSEGTETGTISEAGGVRELSNATTKRYGNQTITGAEND